MAFKPIAEYGEDIVTHKANEFVTVQQVEVTDKTGNNSKHFLDVRVRFQNDAGKLQSTQKGVMLHSVAAVEELIECLQTAVEDGFVGFDPAEAAADNKEDRSNVRKVKRRRRNASSPAAKKTTAAKATSRKR